ncbi:MAG TPA: ABC transporter permease [Kofleriaceae bacterium]|jgi:ABC-2 type transport system permease protein|nr:ABC transporter permease [Kofleriaceae bacterium]
MMSSFLAVFRKEVLHIRRNRGVLIVTVMMPIMQLLLFGSIDQTVHDVPTVVVDQDHSVASRELLDKLRATRTFDIRKITLSSTWARHAIIRGEAGVGIVIPPDYHDLRTRQRPAKILVLIDGSDSTVSAGALAAINGLVAQDNLEILAHDARGGMPMAAQPIILFNPEGRTANYIIPGLVAILMQMIAIFLASGSIVRERERGTMEQLMVTPIDPLGLMLGKVAPYLFLGLGETALILAIMRWAFAVPIQGSLVFLFGIMIVYLAALLAFGLFISTRAKTEMEAMQMAQMLVLPSVFLSGYIFPIKGMPFLLQAVSQILPATHMVAVMRGIVLRDAGPTEMLGHVLALSVFAVVLVWASVRRVSKMTM